MTEIPITFIDLETTGLDPNRHEIIETAVVKTIVSNKKLYVKDDLNYKILPKKPIDPWVGRLNKFNLNVWKRCAVSLDHALAGTIDMMRGCWHAGSNPKFDADFIKKAVDDFDWNYPRLASYHLIDVSVLGFPLIIDGEVEKLKQDTLSKYFGLGACEHTALADAEQCMQIFAVLNKLEIIDERITYKVEKDGH